MVWLRALFVAAATVVLLGTPLARAAVDCEEISLPPAVEPIPTVVIVPCAMVESGQLGPACADAAFYVVNNLGTALCQVELSLFATSSTLPSVEREAPGQGSTFSSSSALAVPAGSFLGPFVPGGASVAPPMDHARRSLADVQLRRPPKPS